MAKITIKYTIGLYGDELARCPNCPAAISRANKSEAAWSAAVATFAAKHECGKPSPRSLVVQYINDVNYLTGK